MLGKSSFYDNKQIVSVFQHPAVHQGDVPSTGGIEGVACRSQRRAAEVAGVTVELCAARRVYSQPEGHRVSRALAKVAQATTDTM